MTKKRSKKKNTVRNKGVVDRILGAGSWRRPKQIAVPQEFSRYMFEGNKGTDFESNLKKLMSSPFIRQLFAAFQDNISVCEIASKKIYSLSSTELLSLYSCSFSFNKDKLRLFSAKVDKFEHLYLTGELSDAKTLYIFKS